MKALSIVVSVVLLFNFVIASNTTDRLLQITTRTSTVAKMCANFQDRYTIVDDKTKTEG